MATQVIRDENGKIIHKVEETGNLLLPAVEDPTLTSPNREVEEPSNDSIGA